MEVSMVPAKIRAVFMRGGTSKALFFHERDLPEDPHLRDRVILAVFGSPDPKQIDGMGGATPVTSKCAIIRPGSRPGIDVDYTFAYVGLGRPFVDYKGNCGNIASAVGPFAIDEGLVQAEEPTTLVRVLNTNTGKVIEEEVPVENGRAATWGDCEIAGVPGTGPRIRMGFVDPGGAATGRLLPTGRVRDALDVPGIGKVDVSIVDAANAVVFVRARDLGLTGAELPEELNARKDLLRLIERIRCFGGAACGLIEDPEAGTARSPAVPKISIVGPAQDHRDTSGRFLGAAEVDLLARMMALQSPHQSYAVTAGVATAAAAALPGSVVHEVVGESVGQTGRYRLANPAGVMNLGVVMEERDGAPHVKKGVIERTARRLMEGFVHVPGRLLREIELGLAPSVVLEKDVRGGFSAD
jgi:2-methylaconitate cis-trans-isomerase PrpF